MFQKITCTLTIFLEHDKNGSYTKMAKPMKTLGIHYPMIKLSIKVSDPLRAKLPRVPSITVGQEVQESGPYHK